MRYGYLYILTNRPHGVLYVGVTNNIYQRLEQHKAGEAAVFTKRYQLHHLVYLERYDTVIAAIAREKQLKNWRRAWKVALIESLNPGWCNLGDNLRDWL